MLFSLNLRLQFAALCFLLLLFCSYFKYRKLPLITTIAFSILLISSLLNIILDICVVYLSAQIHVSLLVHDLCCRLYFISCAFMSYTVFLHTIFIGRKNQRLASRRLLVFSLPFLFAVFFIALYPSRVAQQRQPLLFQFPVLCVCYVEFYYYMFHMFLASYFYRNSFAHEARYSIRLVVFISALVLFLRWEYPNFPLVSLGISLTIFLLYLVFANPLDLLEKETGLFNRHAYQEMIDEKLRNNRTFHVICIQIEDMLLLNAKFGYEFGNELLRCIGDYMSSTYKIAVYHPVGTIISLVVPAKKDRNYELTEKIAARFREQWLIRNMALRVTTRIGVLDCPNSAETADDVQNIVNYFKDIASEDASFATYGVLGSAYLLAKKRVLKIEQMLADAIQNDGFEVFYQPIYSCRESRFLSAEALVRLKDSETLGYVPPDEFISVAENKGMIVEIGSIVFRKVCKFISCNDLQSLGVEYIEINLSGIQCLDSSLPEALNDIMKEYHVDPTFLNLEITETVAISANRSMQDNIMALRALGFNFAMDDFGTGFSNLSQIVNLAYDLIKIDKSLIWPYFESENCKARVLLNSIVNMIQQLNIEIVAEGIETEEQRNVLDKMGIDYLQGYFFSRPVSESHYLEFIKTLT